MRRLFTLLLVLTPALTSAQGFRFELTPTVGYRWGGSIEIEERAFRYSFFDVGVDGSGTYGLRLDIPVSEKFQFELMTSRQDSQLDDGQGLFGEIPSAFVPAGKLNLLAMDLTHYHAGFLWQLGRADFRPFIVMSAGVTHVEPHVALSDDQAFSASIGTGLKMKISDRLGLLFEGRLFWVDTDEEESAVQLIDHKDCTGDCTYTYSYLNDFYQTAVTVGLVFAF